MSELSFKFLAEYDRSEGSGLQRSTQLDDALQSEFNAIDPSTFISNKRKVHNEGTAPPSGEQSSADATTAESKGVETVRHLTSLSHVTDEVETEERPESTWSTHHNQDPDLRSAWDSAVAARHNTTSSLESLPDNSEKLIHSARTTKPRHARQQQQWNALLQNYYRIENSSLSRLTVNDEAMKLVQHYFRDVCVIYSSFDSTLNPFRTTIGRLWDSSSSIFYSIQSMAAAHMANYVPEMARTGLVMQRKAYECLQEELMSPSTHVDKLLLSILLLGLTACWHDSTDLGFAHLNAARSLIRPRLLGPNGQPKPTSYNNDRFFAEALIYWEMIMSVVSPEPVESTYRKASVVDQGTYQSAAEGHIVPHPWSGVAPRIQMLFAEVGRLLRYLHSGSASTFDASQIAVLLESAKELEEELLSATLPTADTIVDPGDERTNTNDFLTIAEITRCAGLLELYRVFPEILRSRLGATGSSPFSSFDELDTLGRDTEPRAWLSSFAIHIMGNFAKVPSSSGTRPLQLLLLNTVASELRLACPLGGNYDLDEATAHNIQVYNARTFALSRLTELSARLPAKPVLKIIELIKEVWYRNDGGEDVFWMDVMNQNNWQTVMG